ncbi:hypothetical protein SAMN05216391_108124 [Lachnospiraceae bacterium KHCPX20]|nr:hypothetical protein SAMN05216391_108124 [Lachnospiraceae bacterium KHCPX20]
MIAEERLRIQQEYIQELKEEIESLKKEKEDLRDQLSENEIALITEKERVSIELKGLNEISKQYNAAVLRLNALIKNYESKLETINKGKELIDKQLVNITRKGGKNGITRLCFWRKGSV